MKHRQVFRLRPLPPARVPTGQLAPILLSLTAGGWERQSTISRRIMIMLKQILVATDFGEPSEVALNYGKELARTFGARLHLLHLVDDIRAHAGEWMATTTNLDKIQAGAEEDARRRLDALLSEEDRRVFRAKTTVATSATIAQGIVDYAREELVDLVIVGTHGRKGAAHFFIGSVAERIVRLASCPVLTVRHPEHEFVRPDALEVVAPV